MSKGQIQYDNDVICQFDKDMGWVEEDGSSPSKTADEQGYNCKLIGTGVAWRSRKTGIWSYCVLFHRGIQTTLLAKSFKQLARLYHKLRERGDAGTDNENKKRWNPYYSAMWERRYKDWCCTASARCDCQLCRKD